LLNDKQREALQRHGISYENAVNVSDAEIISAYQRADLITFVSLAEGFGMPIIEAQAIGRAVITSCLSPMREVAADAACLVDPFSVDDIRSGINRVIRDERYRVTLIEAGWKNVERFRPRIVAQEYADLYAVVVARKLRN
jgi:glycosyltransferase involved in cell wall biosynthesis